MNNLLQFIVFLIVGAISAAVNFCSFYYAWQVFHLEYKLAGSIAYLLAVITHFLGNRYLTFHSTRTNIFPQLKRYALLLALNYCITLATITLTVKWAHLSPYIGLFIAICLTVIIGFLISQRFVFKTTQKI